MHHELLSSTKQHRYHARLASNWLQVNVNDLKVKRHLTFNASTMPGTDIFETIKSYNSLQYKFHWPSYCISSPVEMKESSREKKRKSNNEDDVKITKKIIHSSMLKGRTRQRLTLRLGNRQRSIHHDSQSNDSTAASFLPSLPRHVNT